MIKKQKTLTGLTPPKSRIFSPFRTVGLVTNQVPCCVSTLGDSYVVNTVVGKSVQQYDASSLRLLYMTQPQTLNDIEQINSHFHYLFAVNGEELVVYKRGRAAASTTIPNHAKHDKCKSILIFGEFVCVSYSTNVHVFKWDKTSISHYTTIELPSILGDIVGIVHPPTYLNKIVIATKSCLVLVNIKTGKTVYTFQDLSCTLTLIEACPVALDLVAVATDDGDVHFIDLKADKIMFTLNTSEPISSLSFRSDTGSGSAPLLGIGTHNGDALFYDLNLRRRVQSLRQFSETGAIGNLTFIPGQPICIVNTSDNVLSELVFDPPVSQGAGSHRARVLRRRGGHGAPPTVLLFADSESHLIFSASTDGSLWSFSLRKDSQNRAFGKTQKVDLPATTGMAYSPEKRDRWNTLVTIHKGSPIARSWNADKFSLGQQELPTADGSIAKSVAVTCCGNFAVIGSANGGISVYNLQSGILRKKIDNAHNGAITGLAVTSNNTTIVSCGLDGHVKFHTFKGQLISSVDLEQGACQSLNFNYNSGLVGVTTDSSSLVLLDIKTFKVVREFWGHTGRILDFDFFPNGRRLISTGLDGTLRTWDVFSGLCVDCVRIQNPATKLKVSLDGEWVATSHVRGIGIQMWSIKAILSGLKAVEEPIDIDMPMATGENGSSLLEKTVQDESEETSEAVIANAGAYDKNAPLTNNLATLSGQPKVKFTTLVHLDTIKERNKPEKAPEKPKRAPFFLTAGTSHSEEMDVDLDDFAVPEFKDIDFESNSKVTELLQSENYVELGEYLASLGPAATDLEIRSLDDEKDELSLFLLALAQLVELGTDFELVQAWSTMLFKAHGLALQSEQFKPALEKFEQTESLRTASLQEQVRSCTGMIQFLRTII